MKVGGNVRCYCWAPSQGQALPEGGGVQKRRHRNESPWEQDAFGVQLGWGGSGAGEKPLLRETAAVGAAGLVGV